MNASVAIIAVVNLAIGYALALLMAQEEANEVGHDTGAILPQPQPAQKSTNHVESPASSTLSASAPVEPTAEAVKEAESAVSDAATSAETAGDEDVGDSVANRTGAGADSTEAAASILEALGAVPQEAVASVASSANRPAQQVAPSAVETEETIAPVRNEAEVTRIEKSIAAPALETKAVEQVIENTSGAGASLDTMDLEKNESVDLQKTEAAEAEAESKSSPLSAPTIAATHVLSVGSEDETVDTLRNQLEAAFARRAGQGKPEVVTEPAESVVEDAVEWAEKLLEEATQLVETDIQADAEIEPEQSSEDGNELPSNTPNDLGGGLTNSTCLEAAMRQWWHNDPQRARPISVAQIEIDDVQKLAADYGPRTTDKVVKAIAQMITGNCRRDDLVARLGKSSYLVMLPDTDAHAAATLVDRIRQLVDATEFKRGQNKLRPTITCAVVQAAANDSEESLMDRASSALKEAHGAGRNHTLWLEGEKFATFHPANPGPVSRSMTL